MKSKRIKISKKNYEIFGKSKDAYFEQYLTDRNEFFDVPIAFLEKHCSENAVVFDIGANIGLVSCGVSSIASKGKIYAVEASPNIYKILKKNISTNKISNVEPINIALSNRKHTLKFFEDPAFLAGSRVVNKRDHTRKTIQVPALKLDELVGNIKPKKIDIIKLDVEGHEKQVLEGAQKTLKRFQPFCLIEFNSYVMIYENRELPQDFMKYLKKIFPRIYLISRETLNIVEITNSTDEFIRENLLHGCVDDLICGYEDIPLPSKWFLKNRS